MTLVKYSELPKSIQAIFPGVDKKYADFRCYVVNGPSGERYFVKFDGTTTRFVYKDGCWHADKTW